MTGDAAKRILWLFTFFSLWFCFLLKDLDCNRSVSRHLFWWRGITTSCHTFLLQVTNSLLVFSRNFHPTNQIFQNTVCVNLFFFQLTCSKSDKRIRGKRIWCANGVSSYFFHLEKSCQAFAKNRSAKNLTLKDSDGQKRVNF